MKILVFVETFMYHTLSFVYHEIKELSETHEVLLITTERFYEKEYPFKNIVLIPYKPNKLLNKINWLLEKNDFYLNRKNNSFSKQLNTIIASFKPDIIHTHFGYESIKFLDNINIPEMPVFISFHGYDASQMLKKKCYVNKLNSYLKNKNIIPIYVSNYIRNNLVEAKVNIQNAELLYYGINTDFLNPVLREKTADNTFIFLQISTFNEKKGHIYTLRAFKLFLDRIKDKKKYKLILAGGYILFEQIKQEAISLGLSDYVQFTGPVTPVDVKLLLLKANVFLHHSITASNGDTEGLPNTLLEAMSMELPILSTWHAGIPELVEDGINGYLIKEKDVTFYAQRMEDILNWGYQPKNREKIVSHFSKKVHTQSLINIYEKYK